MVALQAGTGCSTVAALHLYCSIGVTDTTTARCIVKHLSKNVTSMQSSCRKLLLPALAAVHRYAGDEQYVVGECAAQQLAITCVRARQSPKRREVNDAVNMVTSDQVLVRNVHVSDTIQSRQLACYQMSYDNRNAYSCAQPSRQTSSNHQATLIARITHCMSASLVRTHGHCLMLYGDIREHNMTAVSIQGPCRPR